MNETHAPTSEVKARFPRVFAACADSNNQDCNGIGQELIVLISRQSREVHRAAWAPLVPRLQGRARHLASPLNEIRCVGRGHPGRGCAPAFLRRIQRGARHGGRPLPDTGCGHYGISWAMLDVANSTRDFVNSSIERHRRKSPRRAANTSSIWVPDGARNGVAPTEAKVVEGEGDTYRREVRACDGRQVFWAWCDDSACDRVHSHTFASKALRANWDVAAGQLVAVFANGKVC